jgi:membrane-bound lytic murein transglycosylase B
VPESHTRWCALGRGRIDAVDDIPDAMGAAAPYLYEGDGENGIEIYFENEADLEIYKSLGNDHEIVL